MSLKLFIVAQNKPNVLARVVMLFHRLNVEIDALYMVRRRGAESMRINVTTLANRDHAERLEAQLYKLASVKSVAMTRGTKQFFEERDTARAAGKAR